METMNDLKDQVIGYLNMGLHPTVVSFQDDGLYYLFDKLLQGKTTSNSYDPTFTFVHVTLNDVNEQITPELIEGRINDELTRDAFDGDTVIETYSNDVETVCVLDDIAYLDNVPEAIQSADTLIRKYRGVLHFVYVVEDPMLISELKGSIPASSTFLDALMYQEIGAYWPTEELVDLFSKQFNKELPKNKIEEISEKSNNHLGTFKRLYKDSLLGGESGQRYAELMVEELDTSLLNTFKKVLKDKTLSREEDEIFHYYKKVGFVDDSNILIPLMRDIIDGVVIKDKIVFDDNTKEISGIDLDELNKKERLIIETLLGTDSVLTKSQLGDLIWGDKVNDKYSEWAIDQRIARLRKKIIDLGFNIDIQTVYGQGYKISFIQKR